MTTSTTTAAPRVADGSFSLRRATATTIVLFAVGLFAVVVYSLATGSVAVGNVLGIDTTGGAATVNTDLTINFGGLFLVAVGLFALVSSAMYAASRLRVHQ